MPSEPQLPAEPLCLVFGDEDFLVRDRAKQIYDGWCAAAGGMDHEVVDGTVRNADEALQALAKLNEALQTLPFFGGNKVVWLRGANFLGDDRKASSAAVTDRLTELAKSWESFDWQGVQLLISAGKVTNLFFVSSSVAEIWLIKAESGEANSRPTIVIAFRGTRAFQP